MAEPGDPHNPITGQTHDHDDLIGFTSPSSLRAVERRLEPEPMPEPVPEPGSVPQAAPPAPPSIRGFEPIQTGRDDPGDDLFDDLFDEPEPVAAPAPVAPAPVAPEPVAAPVPIQEAEPAPAENADDLGPLFGNETPRATSAATPPPTPRPSMPANMDFESPSAPTQPIPPAAPPPRLTPAEAAMAALPAWARETVRPPKQAPAAFGRARRAEPPQGAMGLYSVYALILFAVPTLGVSALIALFAVTGRPGPDQPLAHSHFLFQQRTLWIAAIGAALGVVLIAVNLGVFVLFAMALWVLLRGTAGLIRLAAGRPITKPTTLLI